MVPGRTKKCGKCKRRKLLKFFSCNGKYRASYCKPCVKRYNHAYELKNRSQRLAYGVSYAKRNYALIEELKSVPCKDCGVPYPPVVMDFDHLPGYVKHRKLSDMAKAQYSEEAIRREAAKCDVVCANCHRLRTAARLKAKRKTTHGW